MQYEIPTTTPWGEPDFVEELAPGIVHFQTPGHGGIWICKEINDTVPMKLKLGTFLGNGLEGWYEEDCDMIKILNLFDLPGSD